MRSDVIRYVVYFLGLILIQVLVLNNMQLSGYLNPYCYILIILILPFETPGWLLLLVGFSMGFIMDVFPQGWSGSGASLGLHSFSTVLVAFLRPFILKRLNPRDEYEAGTLPGASDYGFGWYVVYCLVLVGIHHFTLFSLETMSLLRFPETLLRTGLSTFFTLLLLLVWEGLRYRRN